MKSAPALAAPIGTRTPPESIRAGRSRTWSASDFPQLTHAGEVCSAEPLPSVVVGVAVGDVPRIAHAAQNGAPRGL
jgi:hypothetical protein